MFRSMIVQALALSAALLATSLLICMQVARQGSTDIR
jgi:hypothetical protein